MSAGMWGFFSFAKNRDGGKQKNKNYLIYRDDDNDGGGDIIYTWIYIYLNNLLLL